MEIVVIWSDSAIEELREIYNYYYFKAGRKTANKLTNTIVDLTIKLEQTPRIGQKEELLAHLKKEIRYLVSGNYKIVYLIEDNLVTIATVFDCRQNPRKLKIKNV
jgi:plasmid stabilization system protein ParE